MFNVKGEVNKCHFVTLTDLFLRNLTKLFFSTVQYIQFWLVLILYNSCSIWQPPSSLHTLYLRLMFWYTRSITPGVGWISCAAPITRASRSSTETTGVWYTGGYMCPHRKRNWLALNPAIVEIMQSGRLCLSISARNIGWGVQKLHLQNGVVRHPVETSGIDECPITHLPIIRPILLTAR